MIHAKKLGLGLSLIFLLAGRAWAQPSTAPVPLIPEEASKPTATQATDVSTAQSPDELLVFTDVSVVHLLNAGIESTSGNVSSTRAGVSVGSIFPVNSQLSLGAGADYSENFYRFSGASGLVPDGVRPWGTIRQIGINFHGSYQVDAKWTVLGGANAASTGEQGAKFGSTLTAGGFAGFKYAFSKDLSLGVIMFGESTLESNPTILPFPVVDWALPFDPDHWRFEIGGLRTGPSESVGLGVIYAPSKMLSFSAGLAGVGIGNDFRLDRQGPVPDGVGRDSSVPLIISVNFTPSPHFSLGAFAGINTSDKLDLLTAGGGRINRVDEDAAPLFGLNGSIRF